MQSESPKKPRVRSAEEVERDRARSIVRRKGGAKRYEDAEAARKALADAARVFGEYTTLDVNELEVGVYQRPLRPAWVKRLVESYNPTLFQPLTVALREEDNRYYVVDGQHRLEAAKELRIKRVPCILFLQTDLQGEAAQFVDLQEQRIALGPTQRYHAKLLSEDAEIVALDAILHENGFHVMDSGANGKELNGFQAPSSLLAVYRLDDGQLLDQVLAVMREAWHGHVDSCSGHLVRGIAAFMKRYAARVNRRELVDRLRAFTPRDLATRAVAIMHTARVSQAAATAQTMLEIYNRNRTQSHRLAGSLLEDK